MVMMPAVYLDYNATTPVRAEALDATNRVLRDGYGNPSSTHFAGRRARAFLDEARESMAATLGARPSELIFTSGGTESNNLAIKGVAAKHGHGHIVTSAVEHPAVLETCRALSADGFEITCLPVDTNGRVNPEAVREAIRPDTVLVTVMAVNNETGVIQPVEEIGRIARARGVCFHSDAVQAYGRLPIDLRRDTVDMLSISGHKFCGPKGAGVLFVRRGLRLEPLTHGGGQERGHRSGTENLPGIAAMAEAARLACAERESEQQRLLRLRERLEAGILETITGAAINGAGADRVANTANVRFDGADGEAVLIALDELGIAASSASACAARRGAPSHVLAAMGLTRREGDDSVRFSMGRFTTEEDVEYALKVLPATIARIRGLRP